MHLSSLGLGTYLGSLGPEQDEAYCLAAELFLQSGGRVLDTAANYRHGQSEKMLGTVIRNWDPKGCIVSTKLGYLPMGDGQENPEDWFQRTLLRPGILRASEVVDGCHAMALPYLEHQFQISLQALGRVDILFLHNPEHARRAFGESRFYGQLEEAFALFENWVGQGFIRAYGCATWDGLRVPPQDPAHLSLEKMIDAAEQAGGEGHHFRWLQFPLNMAMPEAFLVPTQYFGGEAMTVLEAAEGARLDVQASAPLLQGRLLGHLNRRIQGFFPGCTTDAQRALQFARSCPGVSTTLCGMSRLEHVRENAVVMGFPKLDPGLLRAVFENSNI